MDTGNQSEEGEERYKNYKSMYRSDAQKENKWSRQKILSKVLISNKDTKR